MTNEIEEESLLKKKISQCIECKKNELNLSSLCFNVRKLPDDVFYRFSSENLAKITGLSFDFNDLEELPKSILTLKNIKKFSAVGNCLTTISSGFGKFVNLEEIRLNENCLCALPVSLGSLCNLKTLSLIANDLITLPDECLSGLSKLEKLYLDENVLQELPENIGCLRALRILDISENKLISLPDSFGELDHLEVLNLSRNNISVLPESFGFLSKLRKVDLSDNHIAKLPGEFKSAPRLESLYVDNNVVGVLPAWFGKLSNILNLSLKDNKLHGSPLPELFPKVSDKTLKKLEIGGNAISQLPSAFGELGQLEELHLGSTICELERRNFQNGNWICELPESFSKLRSINKLYLDENQLIKLPCRFGDLHNLTWIDLGQNLLTYLPESFCCLVLLEYCQLSKNQLKSLPENFGRLESLKDLRLDSNLLEDLPESCCNLKALHTLDLFSNKLTKVPKWLSKLTSLRRLDLDKNNFHLKLRDIPHITSEGSKYAKRDPKLINNWRGKMRADKVRGDVIVIKQEENEDEDSEEEIELPATYNEHVLAAAMRRGLSIWRSHDGPSERNSPIWEDDMVFNVYEDSYDDATTAYGFYVKMGDHGKDNEDDFEDWDKEINKLWGKSSPTNLTFPLRCGVNVSDIQIEKRDEFLSVLSSYPPATQAYSWTATYNSLALKNEQCNSTQTTTFSAISSHGQFDDA